MSITKNNKKYEKENNVGLYSDIYRLIYIKLGMTWITTLYILILDWMILTFIEGHSYMRNQNTEGHRKKKKRENCWALVKISMESNEV